MEFSGTAPPPSQSVPIGTNISHYHGVWDINSFHDLATDPHERHNLIRVPAYQETISYLREKLFSELSDLNGLTMPLRPPKGIQFYDRKLR